MYQMMLGLKLHIHDQKEDEEELNKKGKKIKTIKEKK